MTNIYYATLLDWAYSAQVLWGEGKPTRMDAVAYAVSLFGLVDRECLDAINLLARHEEIQY